MCYVRMVPISNYTHKTGSWYVLWVLFKISDKHLRLLYMGFSQCLELHRAPVACPKSSMLTFCFVFLGNIPTTDVFPAGDVAMSVIKQDPHDPGGRNARTTPWQQYRTEDSLQTGVVFGYVIVLCSRRTEEMWLCDMTSSCPDEVIVVNRHKHFFLL